MKIHLDDLPELGTLDIDISLSVDETGALLEGDQEYSPREGLQGSLRAMRATNAIRVTGPVRATFGFECGSCLEPGSYELDANAEFILMSRADWSSQYETDDEIELDPDDLDVSFYEGDELDLRELVRELIILELPPYPRCVDEVACEKQRRANLGDLGQEKLEKEEIDLRWSALKDIKLASDGGSD